MLCANYGAWHRYVEYMAIKLQKSFFIIKLKIFVQDS